jgi:hypothetical protein
VKLPSRSARSPAAEGLSIVQGSTPGPAPAAAAGPICACGHLRTAHEHYRRGTDCALCTCAQFHRRGLLGRLHLR